MMTWHSCFCYFAMFSLWFWFKR